MARAGFYAVESGKISFRRDGNWYTDEERIDNPRIALLFSKSIRRNPDGSYYLQVAEERAPIAVEDTPNVVYCRVKQGESRARFLRNAYYHLSSRFSADEGGGAFSILIGDRRYPIRIAPEGDRANGRATQRA